MTTQTTKKTVAKKATTKKSNSTKKVATKKTTKQEVKEVKQPVDKSVDKSVDNLVEVEIYEPKIKTIFDKEKVGNEVQDILYTTLIRLADKIHAEQPSNQGYDKTHLDLFVHAPSHVNLNNVKKYIKCNATSGKDINIWAQHMSIILVDELRKAVTRPFFKPAE